MAVSATAPAANEAGPVRSQLLKPLMKPTSG